MYLFYRLLEEKTQILIIGKMLKAVRDKMVGPCAICYILYLYCLCLTKALIMFSLCFAASASNVVPTVCNGREVVDSTTSSL